MEVAQAWRQHPRLSRNWRRAPITSCLIRRNLQSDSVDNSEMLPIPGHQRETGIEGGCGDQRIKGPETVRLRIGLEEVVRKHANSVIDVHDGIQSYKTVDAGDVPFVSGADDQLVGSDDCNPSIRQGINV